MKAVVYLVLTEEGWLPGWSVAWEADARYWLEEKFRDGVRAEWMAEAGASLKGTAMVRLKEPVPLGLAEAASEWLAERLRARRRKRERGESRGSGRDGAAGPLRRGRGRGMEAGGDQEKSDAAKAGEWLREAVLAAYAAAESGGGGRVTFKRRKSGADEPVSMPTETVLVSSGGNVGRESLFKEGRALASLARIVAERLRGRSLLQEEAAPLLAQALPAGGGFAAALRALQLAALLGAVRLTAAVAPQPLLAPGRGPLRRAFGALFACAAEGRGGAALRCRRCGGGPAQMWRTWCAACGRRCAYCEACLTMGRSRECGLLAIGTLERERGVSRPAAAEPAELAARWGLSPAQAAAAAAALSYLARLAPAQPRPSGSAAPVTAIAALAPSWPSDSVAPVPAVPRPSDSAIRTFLLWAVTGAGKTEMIFPLVDSVLASGGRVLIATPRRDVVLELAPRLSRAFPNAKRAVLYGGSADKFANADLILATTHQLLRFQGAFDLVLIDELDAYPYHNNPMLRYAAAKAGRSGGATVLLSATPPADLKRQALRGKLGYARVPVRHHGFPLPVPRRLQVPDAARWLRVAKPPAKLLKAIVQSLERGAQVFLFVPIIRLAAPLVEALRLHLRLRPDSIQGTSSEDEARTEKVDLFRRGSIRLLVTTTILERGVTIPKSDVFVLDADKPSFDAAALEQMAGRAGRSRDDPAGNVYFAASSWTSAQRKACREIRGMNREAMRKGYFSAQGRERR